LDDAIADTDEMVRLKQIESTSDETVRRTLNKTR
jgi:hypothetical protein